MRGDLALRNSCQADPASLSAGAWAQQKAARGRRRNRDVRPRPFLHHHRLARDAPTQSVRPPTAEFDCDEVWTCEELLSVFSITTGSTLHQFHTRLNQQDEVLE